MNCRVRMGYMWIFYYRHDELLSQDGVYADMWNQQLSVDDINSSPAEDRSGAGKERRVDKDDKGDIQTDMDSNQI